MPSVAATGKNIWIASSDGDLDRVKVRLAVELERRSPLTNGYIRPVLPTSLLMIGVDRSAR